MKLRIGLVLTIIAALAVVAMASPVGGTGATTAATSCPDLPFTATPLIGAGSALSTPDPGPLPTRPRDLQIVAVPGIAGVAFTLDSTLHVTPPDGIVRLADVGRQDLAHRLHFTQVTTDPSLRMDFVRFSDLSDAESTGRVFAVFDVARPVRFSFAEADGTPVPSTRVGTMNLRSSQGTEFALTPSDLDCPVMLPALRTTSAPGRPRVSELQYRVEEVVVDGSNVVNRSQQQFVPAQSSQVDLETLFFTVNVAVHDRLFGFANGSAVLVRAPDGSESRLPVVDGSAVLPAAARGGYKMRVDALGLRVWRPISISKDQTVDLEVVSVLDLLVGLGVLALIATGAFVARRRRMARW